MISLLKKASILLIKCIAALAGLLLLIFSIKYITCPVYDFKQGMEFTGDHFYNPYAGMHRGQWLKANFQIQSHAWGGLTAGSKNTSEEIYSLYKKFGYDIIAISDYQKINRFGEGQPGYIPVYEHGYGLKKTHQVLIGAERVLWKDYPFFQTLHNKQHIIESLRKDHALIFLAHPTLRKGYLIDEMKILSGYDGIEVLDNLWISMEHWDAALSSGNYVTIIGNDDAHDVFNPEEIGNHITFIHSLSSGKDDVMEAFRAGKVYAARITGPQGETMQEKIDRTRVLPMPLRHDVVHDTIFVQCDSTVRFIRFIGQHGVGLKTTYDTDRAFYKITGEDTYLRAEIHFLEGSALYFNPVCRHDGKGPTRIPPPEVNLLKTWTLRILGFSTLIFLWINYFYVRKRFIRKK